MRKLFTILLSATLLMTACSQGNEDQGAEKNSPQTEKENNTENNPPEKPPVKELTQSFRDLLTQETNDQGAVKDFDTKSALVEALTDVTDEQLAQTYVNQFYKERDGRLYLVEQDGPAWLNHDKPYELIKTDKNTYKVTQENDNELREKHRITIVFQLRDNRWIIKEKKIKTLSQPDKQPDKSKDKTDSGKETNDNKNVKNKNEKKDNSKNENDNQGNQQASGTEVVSNPNDLLVLVNKQHRLPADYVPSDLVEPDVRFPFEQDLQKKLMRKPAAQALEKMFAAAENDGVHLFAQSGYRSFDRQEAIFASNVREHGKKKANTFSAQAGESEHQTGLTMDVTAQSVGFRLVTGFANTKAGKWVKKHASEFGFIVRYPKGKSEITGYQYEPWHLRYVGKKAAKEMDRRSMTLEKYVGAVK